MLGIAGIALLESIAAGLHFMPGMFEPLIRAIWSFLPGLAYDPALRGSVVALFVGFGLLWCALMARAFEQKAHHAPR